MLEIAVLCHQCDKQKGIIQNCIKYYSSVKIVLLQYVEEKKLGKGSEVLKQEEKNCLFSGFCR